MRIVICDRYGDDVANEFFTDYCSTLSHLTVVSRLTRKAALLTDVELDQLETACKGFATAFRTVDAKRTYAVGHVKGTLTCKGHTIEKHVVDFARRFGTCGWMGEDGLESLHPLHTKARILNRSIRNPVARIHATANRLAFIQGVQVK